MAHSGTLSKGESIPRTRQTARRGAFSQYANPMPRDNPSDRFVYVATEEYSTYNNRRERRLFEIYAAKEDANRRLNDRRESYDLEDWVEHTDRGGCWHAFKEDEKKDRVTFHVERVLVKPPGSVVEDKSSSDDGEEDDGDSISDDPELATVSSDKKLGQSSKPGVSEREIDEHQNKRRHSRNQDGVA
ncbi:MAG: hypothetical protein Q9209_006512 [Squamulea sp. 1 TL-2023]